MRISVRKNEVYQVCGRRRYWIDRKEGVKESEEERKGKRKAREGKTGKLKTRINIRDKQKDKHSK